MMENPSLLYIILFLLSLLCAVLFFFFIFRKRSQKKTTTSAGLFFESSKGPLFYQKEGKKGPFVLLVHGLGASSYCWRHTVRDLKAQFQVITVDLWGFGQSYKKNATTMNLDDQIQTLRELMQSLGADEFHVVGHSMGGHISLWLTRMHPENIKKVVVIAPASHPRVAPPGIQKLKWIAKWTPLLVTPKLVRWILRREVSDLGLITDELVEAYHRPYQDPDSHLSFAAAIAMIEDPRVFEQLVYIDRDVLLLWGEKDSVINKKTIELINRKLPRSKLVTNPKSHHLPMEDAPLWLNQQIITFLKSRQD